MTGQSMGSGNVRGWLCTATQGLSSLQPSTASFHGSHWFLPLLCSPPGGSALNELCFGGTPLQTHYGLWAICPIGHSRGGQVRWEDAALRVVTCTKGHTQHGPGSGSPVFFLSASSFSLSSFSLQYLCGLSQSACALACTHSFLGEGLQPGVCTWCAGAEGRFSASP